MLIVLTTLQAYSLNQDCSFAHTPQPALTYECPAKEWAAGRPRCPCPSRNGGGGRLHTTRSWGWLGRDGSSKSSILGRSLLLPLSNQSNKDTLPLPPPLTFPSCGHRQGQCAGAASDTSFMLWKWKCPSEVHGEMEVKGYVYFGAKENVKSCRACP